jgi:hypothetical protein
MQSQRPITESYPELIEFGLHHHNQFYCLSFQYSLILGFKLNAPENTSQFAFHTLWRLGHNALFWVTL